MKQYILLSAFAILPIFLSNAQDNKLHENELLSTRAAASSSGSFFIAGDENAYYPVAFVDYGWSKHQTAVIEIGRSSTHQDKQWNGSLIATFTFHITNWGHGSEFVNANIRQSKNFIAGWQDASINNANMRFVIWLRGNATYFYNSRYPQEPILSSGAITLGNKTFEPKTSIDSYVNTNGKTLSHSIKVNSSSPSSFAGKVGIGTSDPKNMLDVAGTISAREVKVEISAGADHVFSSDYDLKPLSEVANFIQENKHLPEIPSEKQMQEEGLNMNQFQIKLLQKIEELTLYVIAQDKQNQSLQTQIEELKKQLQNQ